MNLPKSGKRPSTPSDAPNICKDDSCDWVHHQVSHATLPNSWTGLCRRFLKGFFFEGALQGPLDGERLEGCLVEVLRGGG